MSFTTLELATVTRLTGQRAPELPFSITVQQCRGLQMQIATLSLFVGAGASYLHSKPFAIFPVYVERILGRVLA